MHNVRTGLRRLSPLLALTLCLGMVPAFIAASGAPTVHAAPVPHATAAVTANPVSGAGGSAVTVTGANIPYTDTAVMLKFVDKLGTNTALTTTSPITTDSTGAFTASVIVPPTAAIGPGDVMASVSTTVLLAPFDVRPSATLIGLAPTSAIPGSSIAVTGTGFVATGPFTLTFTEGTSVTTLFTGTTTAQGTFSQAVTIPGSAANGAATVTASDNDSNSAQAAFTVVRNGAPTVAVTPTTALTNTTLTLTGVNFAAGKPITVTFGQGTTSVVLISGTVSTNSSGAFTTTVTVPATASVGAATFTATDSSLNQGVTAFTVGSPVNVNNGPTTAYFAEGYTGLLATNKRATYDETLSILNANPFTATATITYLVEGANPVGLTREVPPSSTLLESVNTDVGTDKSVAAIVSSPSKISVQRVIRRTGVNGAVLDADASLGSPNLAKTIYFPEGYIGISFQEYLTLANPGSVPANVTATFAPEANTASGAPAVTATVPPNGRVTINVRRAGLSLSNKSVGLIINSDQPIMAERVLYFGNGDGSAKFGSTASPGVQTAASQYVFAYGSSGGTGLAQSAGDQSFITVLNPNTASNSTTVTAQFYDTKGNLIGTASTTVAGGTRQTIRINSVLKNYVGIYSTVLSASSPFVAEKPQYYGGSPNDAQHPGVALSGITTGVSSASFPDLSLSSLTGAAQQQTIFLYNPTTSPIVVTGTYYSAGGATKTVSYNVAASNIATVNVNSDAASLPTGALGATFSVSSGSFVATEIGNTTDGLSYTGTQGVPAP